MLLLFGGRTYTHFLNPHTGDLIYHECENMPKSNFLDPAPDGDIEPPFGDGSKDWRSCMEEATNEIWRYDTVFGCWMWSREPGFCRIQLFATARVQFLQLQRSVSLASGAEPVALPEARDK